jgi:hypothetical protein
MLAILELFARFLILVLEHLGKKTEKTNQPKIATKELNETSIATEHRVNEARDAQKNIQERYNVDHEKPATNTNVISDNELCNARPDYPGCLPKSTSDH